MPKITLADAELYYQVSGNGAPVLLIAGFGCDHLIWGMVASQLSKNYQVITFDNRGMGRSTAASGDYSRMTIGQLAEDAAALLEALGTGPTHIVGHSMGGLIAQEFAITFPQRVRSLSLISSCSGLDARGKAILTEWGSLPEKLDAETSARLVLPWMYTDAAYRVPGFIDDLVSKMLANPYPPSAAAIRAQSRATCDTDTTDRLQQLNSPTLVLVGQEDILLPVSFSEQLAAGIPGAELVVLDKTGHGLLIESPEAMAAALTSFLAKQS